MEEIRRNPIHRSVHACLTQTFAKKKGCQGVGISGKDMFEASEELGIEAVTATWADDEQSFFRRVPRGKPLLNTFAKGPPQTFTVPPRARMVAQTAGGIQRALEQAHDDSVGAKRF